MAVEGRKRTFPLTGPYVPAAYTSAKTEPSNEMPRPHVTSGNKAWNFSDLCIF